MPRDFQNLKGGETLQAYHLNDIYEELRRLRKMAAAPPLVLRSMASATDPPRLEYQRENRMRIGIANGNIAAGNSTTPATGTVDLQYLDMTNTNYVKLETITVYNASSSTMNSGQSIDNGKRVVVEWDADNVPWVSPLDC